MLIACLIVGFEHDPHILGSDSIKDVVTGSFAKGKDDLEVHFLVTLTPLEVILRVSGGVGSSQDAVYYILESLVLEDQDLCLALVGVIFATVIEI